MMNVPEPDDSYYFEILKNDQRDEVLQFLFDNFVKDEPLNRAANITNEEIRICLNLGLDRALKNEISILARSKIDNKIVGCMINSVWNRNDIEKKSKDVKEEDFEFKTSRKQVETIGEILNDLHESFWSTQGEDIQTVIHFEISSVNIHHRFKGIASKFMNFTENEELLKSVSASGIVAEVTSFGNQRLLEKRNYTTLLSTPLSSKLDENGEQVLSCDDGTTEVRLMFKKIL